MRREAGGGTVGGKLVNTVLFLFYFLGYFISLIRILSFWALAALPICREVAKTNWIESRSLRIKTKNLRYMLFLKFSKPLHYFPCFFNILAGKKNIYFKDLKSP
jgi:hypothetical protein